MVHKIAILDWDDTLIPTTHIFKNKQPSDENTSTNQLHNIGKLVYQLLSKYITLYGRENVFIATNAEKKWVYWSLHLLNQQQIVTDKNKTYFKAIENLLITQKIDIISGKDLYKTEYPKQTAVWKRLAFEQIIGRVHSENVKKYSILSIGDSMDEFKAAHNATKILTKTYKIDPTNIILHRIKLKYAPTIDILTNELRLIASLSDALYGEESISHTIDYEQQLRSYMKPKSKDIDNVIEDKGDQYANWIKITKQKLKERESESMSVRITTLQRVINTQCEHFEQINSNNGNIISVTSDYHSIIQKDDLMTQCLNKLNSLLSTWNGVNVAKSKDSLTTFRKYFAIGKCWFDYKKKTIMSTDFWIKYFSMLETFTTNSANIYFKSKHKELQKLYSKHLLFQIILGIFNTQIRFQSTKPQPIIPSSIIRDSTPMKTYLNNLHNTLNIDQIILENTNTSNRRKKLSAKELITLLSKQLKYLTAKFQMEFQQKLKQTYHNVKIKTINAETNLPETQNSQQQKKSNSPLKLIQTLKMLNLSDVHTNTNLNYSYNNNHTSSQTVITQRYNPLNVLNNNIYNGNNNYNYKNNNINNMLPL